MTDDNETRDDTDILLVERVLHGDSTAFASLYDRWFDRVLDLAYRILYDENAAADVAQDAFLSAWRNLNRLEDPRAFGGWLLRIARNGALDRKRKEQRARPVDDVQLAMIERAEDRIGTLDDPARIAEDASYVALLWDAADALGARDREVLDLHLRHGLAPGEIGDVIGINRNAANQLVHRVRQRLGTAVGARMLWRGGAPVCSALRAELVAAEIDQFGPDAMRVADQHAAGCAECSERRRVRLDPAKLFASIPIMSIPALKAKVAFALAAQKVPVETSGRGPHPGRLRRMLIGAGAVAAVIVLVFIINAVAADHDPRKVQVIASTASTVRPTSTTAAATTSTSTSTTSTSVATTTTVLVIVPPVSTVPPTIPPSTTTTIAPVVTFSLDPTTAPTLYPMSQAPMLSWNATGYARVHITDSAQKIDSTKTSGSVAVCEGTIDTDNDCNTTPNVFTFTFDAFDAANHRLVHLTRTLTVQ